MADAQVKAYALLNMQQTQGWEIVAEYIQQRAQDSRQRLMDCTSWEKVHEHRGEATALEAVLAFVDQTIRKGDEE